MLACSGRSPSRQVSRADHIEERLHAVDQPLLTGRKDVECSGFGDRNTAEDRCRDVPDTMLGVRRTGLAGQPGAHRREVDVNSSARGLGENTGVDERLGDGPVVGQDREDHRRVHGLCDRRGSAGTRCDEFVRRPVGAVPHHDVVPGLQEVACDRSPHGPQTDDRDFAHTKGRDPCPIRPRTPRQRVDCRRYAADRPLRRDGSRPGGAPPALAHMLARTGVAGYGRCGGALPST